MANASTASQSGQLLNGGLTMVYVDSVSQAVDFYSKTLGFKVKEQFGEDWAEIDAGNGMLIGLHPANSHSPKPGTRGATSLSFSVMQPLEKVVEILKSRGVQFFGPIMNDDPVKLAFCADPDGNPITICEEKKMNH